MASYPIKMLKDETNIPFVPLTSTDGIVNSEGKTLQTLLEDKVGVEDLLAGTNIGLSVNDANHTITINNTATPPTIINNLTTDQSNQGSLDAYQGKILNDKIPEVVDNLTTLTAGKALSAHQGYILSNKSVIPGGNAGQVLKKSAGTDYALEWGDAADPNAIVGDGTILKIVECTYEQYKAMETAGTLVSTTEYHIADMPANNLSYITRDEIQAMIDTAVLNSKLTIYPIGSIYTSVTSTSPATLFGGTWTQLKDRFLLSAGDTYTNGATGGEATHTLTIDEMPSHSHGIYGALTGETKPVTNTGNDWGVGISNYWTINTSPTGGDQAHNNMPPYLVVYMWKRTA